VTTPSQTVGPFFHFGLEPNAQLAAPGDPNAVRIRGAVYDGDAEPVADALIETWQASAEGRFDDAEFPGFARVPTDDAGAFEIVTVKPGPVDGQAPHIDVSVFARGLLRRLVTRIYFPDEEHANAADPVLASITDDAARGTLVAEPDTDGDALRFDIHLQGDRQTAFFDI
jgi:protocatechuate 3,4-dioxygenase alpha subunit